MSRRETSTDTHIANTASKPCRARARLFPCSQTEPITRQNIAANPEAPAIVLIASAVPGWSAKYAMGVLCATKYATGGHKTAAAIRNETKLRLRGRIARRSEEHTSELQSLRHLVCRL